ncbi:MAG: hypothetical protein M0013_00705, partial [Actinomycetota bacterium]|nr:hypothetical protein [Actinomycetota bacterium]
MRARTVLVALLGLAPAAAACGSTSVGTSSNRVSSGATTHVSSPATVSTAPAPPSASESGGSAAGPAATRVPPAADVGSSPGACRSGNPLANVYHPYRLHVVKDCMTVTGTVASVRHEDDGDLHINLSLPPAEANLLDQANVADEHGELVTEIVPADQPGCTPGQQPPLPPTAYTSPSYSYGTCTGADIVTPPLGAQVTVTGPYVLDADHGWMEIHPVWSITVTGQSASSTTDAAPPVSASAPNPTPPSTGAWCQASASPSNDGYSTDYQVYVRSNQPGQK